MLTPGSNGRQPMQMLPYDFESGVGYWIYLTWHALVRSMNLELQSHGITYRQWEVLAWLSISGPVSQSELADRMQIEAPTLVGVLDRMERDGWIERVPSETDRRKKIVQPTEQVLPLWDKMVGCALKIRARAVAGIPEEQLATLRSVLQKIRANLEGEGADDE